MTVCIELSATCDISSSKNSHFAFLEEQINTVKADSISTTGYEVIQETDPYPVPQ